MYFVHMYTQPYNIHVCHGHFPHIRHYSAGTGTITCTCTNHVHVPHYVIVTYSHSHVYSLQLYSYRYRHYDADRLSFKMNSSEDHDRCFSSVQTSETASEEREQRLQCRREQARARRASETVEHREERLRNRGVRDRARRTDQTAAETAEEREARLYKQPETDKLLSHQRRERPGYSV